MSGVASCSEHASPPVPAWVAWWPLWARLAIARLKLCPISTGPTVPFNAQVCPVSVGGQHLEPGLPCVQVCRIRRPNHLELSDSLFSRR